jgi:hypothetical protein
MGVCTPQWAISFKKTYFLLCLQTVKLDCAVICVIMIIYCLKARKSIWGTQPPL